MMMVHVDKYKHDRHYFDCLVETTITERQLMDSTNKLFLTIADIRASISN